MKLNEIKFTPKSNAFADVYSKATGMPFIGELMCAAAAQDGGEDGGDDTQDPILTNCKVINMGGGCYDFSADSDSTAYEGNWEITLAVHFDKDGVDTVAFTVTVTPDPENANKFIGSDNDDIEGEFSYYAENGGTFTSLTVAGEGLDFDGIISGTWTYIN